jgi:hypothetical protein
MGLLQAMVEKCTKQTDILIVDHGTETGLSMKLIGGDSGVHVSGSQVEAKLDRKTLALWERKENNEVVWGSVATALGLSYDELEKLEELVQKVRKLHLNRLALRACSVGQSAKTLTMLKRFFGCASLSAPKYLDIYFQIPVDFAKGSILAYTKKFPRRKVHGSSPNRYALHVEEGTYKIYSAFESKQAVMNWIASKLPKGGSYSGGSALPAHAMSAWVTKRTVIWAGEKRYRKGLVKV